jgi:hypothetical protein
MSASDRKQKIDELKAQLDALYKDEKEENLKLADEYLRKALHKIIIDCHITSHLEIQKIVEKAAESFTSNDMHEYLFSPNEDEKTVSVSQTNKKLIPPCFPNKHDGAQRNNWGVPLDLTDEKIGMIYTCSRHPLNTHPHNWSFEPSECPNCECPRTTR